MKILSKFSIKQKIIYITLLVTISSIAIIFTADILNNLSRFRSDLINSRTLSTQLIAENCITTLVFDDKEGANVILKTLKEVPDVLGAFLFDAKGNEFAHYFRGEMIKYRPGTNISGNWFDGHLLYINKPVTYKNEKVGFINIVISTEILKHQNRKYLLTTIFTLIAILIGATLLAVWVQSFITKPILTLSRFADQISNSEEFTSRIKKTTNDEIGTLYDRFNFMLERIEKRENERDKAKKELEYERETLEVRVKERTEELKIALEKAEESDQLKSAFLANISHEIRTPMNAIIGFSEFLKDDTLPTARKEEFIEIIESSGNQLLNIINDIVEISKIEMGLIQRFEENVNILTMCEFLYKELSIIPNPEKVRFVFKKPEIDKLYFTVCDKTKLSQVLTNFITNAFKFTEHGTVEFGFEFNNDNIRFYVKDTGVGIDKKYHDAIFERFRRIEDKDQKVKSGSGLGLAISKAYVELMGGTIGVESEPWIGSTFFFTIPNIQSKTTKSEQDKSLKHSPLTEIDTTFLIAEDDDLNFKYLQFLLANYKVRIIRASNGQEAVEKALNDDSISLVLMDLKMPLMDGYEATRLIKEKKPKLPIIATTAYALSSDKEKALAAGCDAYVSKPIMKDELFENISMVRQLVKR